MNSENVIACLKETIDREGQKYLTEKPYEVYLKLKENAAADSLLTGALLTFLVNGMMELVPLAKIGHIGMYRDEETHEPHAYYCKLPPMIDRRLIVVVDPMVATGGSLIDAVTKIKELGGKDIKCMCIIAAPEGVEAFTKAHPDVELYIGCLDRCLNENAYICPGLGDAGDRIFGTK